MKNKVLVELVVPTIESTFDIYLPINKRIGNIITLLNKFFTYIEIISYKIQLFHELIRMT